MPSAAGALIRSLTYPAGSYPGTSWRLRSSQRPLARSTSCQDGGSVSDSVRTVTAAAVYSSLTARASARSGPPAPISRCAPVSRSTTRSWVAAPRPLLHDQVAPEHVAAHQPGVARRAR